MYIIFRIGRASKLNTWLTDQNIQTRVPGRTIKNRNSPLRNLSKAVRWIDLNRQIDASDVPYFLKFGVDINV